jgi:23S rRNA (cytosine1962-C5)-methyltransferase
MQALKTLKLKKNEERRLRNGHSWIYSNEVDTKVTPLKSFTPGEEVIVEAHDKTPIGIAYVNPHSLIAGRLISRNISTRFDEDFLLNKFQIALALRTRLYDKPFYRLAFGDSDGLPGIVIDRFNDVLVVQLNTAGADAKKEPIITALRRLLPDLKGILFRNDSSARLQEGLATEVVIGWGEAPETIIVEENDTLFHAPIWQGQKTGWFYDHRLNREAIQKYVKGKRVLDVFSYLGAWGLQAAKKGAKEVVCIDSSALATQWIKDNAKLNAIDEKVTVICDDAFDALKNLNQAKEKFDVIIIDPPAFAKKQKDIKEGLLAYQRINELALKLLAEDGILVSCSCSMHVAYSDLVHAIRKAAHRTQAEIQILERGHQAQDHPVHATIPETDYLKMVVGRKLAI